MAQDARKKFQTYLFFLRHFDRLIRAGRDDTSPERLITVLVEEQHPLLAEVATKTLTQAETDRVRKLLFNAWNSEVAARLNSVFDPEVRVITNQWKPVQTYYALYFLLAAIHELEAPDHKHGHELTLRFATNSIRDRVPQPWRCWYDFDNKTCHEFPWAAPPPVQSGWNLANQPEPRVFVVHFYRTTGEEKRYERWLDHGKGKKHKQGPRAGKRILQKDIKAGTISFWDVLWRMRKWVNYKEAQALLEGQERPDHVEEFDESLNSILTASAAVLEHILYGLLGDELISGMYRAYLDFARGRVDCAALATRRDVICGLPF